MKNLKRIPLITMALLLGLLAASSAPLYAHDTDAEHTHADGSDAKINLPDVVARVDDLEISAADFEFRALEALRMSRGAAMMRGQKVPPGGISLSSLTPDQRYMLLEGMIGAKVVEALAAREGISASTQEVDAEIEEGRNAMEEEFGKGAFEGYLKRENKSVDTLRTELQEKLVRDKYEAAKTGDITVSDEEVRAEYDRLIAKDSLKVPEDNTDIQHILIAVQGEDEAKWEEGKAKADSVRARIVGGEDFVALVKEASDDRGSKRREGLYKAVTPSARFGAEFHAAIAATEVDGVSEPFRSKHGWHIIKVLKRRAAGFFEFDDVKEALEDGMLNEKRRNAMLEIIAEAKKSLKVEIFLPEPTAPPELPSSGLGDAAELLEGSS